MKRADQKSQTRETIIEVAKKLFESKGFAATSIREIGKGAGVAAGTVLLHFRDKEDLLHAALFFDLEREVDDALATLPTGSIDKKLAHITARLFAYYEARPKLSRTLLRESLLAEQPWSARFAAQVGKVHVRIVSIVNEAKKEGELLRKTSPDLLSAAYFSFYYFALIAWVQEAHKEPTQLVEHLMRQHLEGLRGTTPRTKKRNSP